MVQVSSILLFMMLSINMANPFTPRPPIKEHLSWHNIKQLNIDSSGAHFKRFFDSDFEADNSQNLVAENLIVVPGFADDIEVFTPLTNYLSSHFEQKNHSLTVRGFTPPYQGNPVHQPHYVKPRGRMLSFDNHYLEPLDKLIGSTQGEKTFLLGHSTGATGIMVKILQQPEIADQLKGVVLLAPFLGLSLPKKPRMALQKFSTKLLPGLDSTCPNIWQTLANSLLSVSVGLPSPLAHITRSLTAGIYQHELAKRFAGRDSGKEFFLKQRDMSITGEWIVRVSAAQEYIRKNIHKWPKDLPLLVLMYQDDTVVSEEALSDLLQSMQQATNVTKINLLGLHDSHSIDLDVAYATAKEIIRFM